MITMILFLSFIIIPFLIMMASATIGAIGIGIFAIAGLSAVFSNSKCAEAQVTQASETETDSSGHEKRPEPMDAEVNARKWLDNDRYA